MAASFEKSITYDMLELIDENREEEKINENQYIQMCNALKFISSKMEKPEMCKRYLMNKKVELTNNYNIKLKEYKQIQKKRATNAIKHITHIIIAQQHNLFEERISLTLDYWTNYKMHVIKNEETGRSSFTHEYGNILPKMKIIHYLGGRYIHMTGRMVYGKNIGEYEPVSNVIVNYFQNYIISNCPEYNSIKKLKNKYSEINDNEYGRVQNKFANAYLIPIYNELQDIENILTDM